MAIIYNNTLISQPVYNGVTLREVYCNGVLVWPNNTDGLYAWYETNSSSGTTEYYLHLSSIKLTSSYINISDRINGGKLNQNGEFSDQYSKTIIDNEIKPKSCSEWFSGQDVGEIVNFELIDFSECTSLSGMFRDAGPTAVEFSSTADLSKVTTMAEMFYNSTCKTIKISNLNVENVLDTSKMFYQMLDTSTSLDLTGLNFKNVTNASSMFYRYFGPSADLSIFNNAKLQYLDGMFCSCHISDVSPVSNWDVSEAKSVSGMFLFSYSLTSPASYEIDLSSWQLPADCAIDNMFYWDREVKIIKINNFNPSSSNNIYGSMFAGCSILTTIYCNSTWPHHDSKNESMFKDCTQLVGGTGFSYNASRINDVYASPSYYFTSV